MAEFTVNATRFDPYKSFMFRVKWDGQLRRGPVEDERAQAHRPTRSSHREGGDPTHERKSPGKSKYDAVTLERGVTHDPAFESWANLVHSLETPDLAEELPQGRHRRRLQRGRSEGAVVQAVPRAGSPSTRRCPQLDAGTAAVAIETIKLELEGWERDDSVTEPTEQ